MNKKRVLKNFGKSSLTGATLGVVIPLIIEGGTYGLMSLAGGDVDWSQVLESYKEIARPFAVMGTALGFSFGLHFDIIDKTTNNAKDGKSF